MAVLIVTGPPCSGKTRMVNMLIEGMKKNQADLFENIVHLDDFSCMAQVNPIKDCTRDVRGEIYAELNKEKNLRAQVKSETFRILNDCTPKDLLIVDSLNYIKGFRYELFCLAKSLKKCYAVLYIKTQKDKIKAYNFQINRYSEELLEEMLNRYEIPNDKNKWDHPLFTLVNDKEDFMDEDEYMRDIPMDARHDSDPLAKENVYISDESITDLADALSKVLNKKAGAVALKSNQSTETVAKNTEFIPMIEKICNSINEEVLEQSKNLTVDEKPFILPDKYQKSSIDAKLSLRKQEPLTKFKLSAGKRNFIKFILKRPISSSKGDDVELRIVQMYLNFLNNLID